MIYLKMIIKSKELQKHLILSVTYSSVRRERYLFQMVQNWNIHQCALQNPRVDNPSSFVKRNNLHECRIHCKIKYESCWLISCSWNHSYNYQHRSLRHPWALSLLRLINICNCTVVYASLWFQRSSCHFKSTLISLISTNKTTHMHKYRVRDPCYLREFFSLQTSPLMR